MSTSLILIYIFLGSTSLSYMMYAKSQRKAIALISSIILGILPYFNLSIWLMLLLSFIVMALPFFIHT